MDSHHHDERQTLRAVSRGDPTFFFATGFDEPTEVSSQIKPKVLEARISSRISQQAIDLLARPSQNSSSKVTITSSDSHSGIDIAQYNRHKIDCNSSSSGHLDPRNASCMADNSAHTETSTEIEFEGKFEVGKDHGCTAVSISSGHEGMKSGDSKTARRLAQNREAARKSRLKKKAYVQQLESSRIKLNQLEQELQRARQQVAI